MNKLEQTEKYREIASLLSNSMECLAKAGALVVEMIDSVGRDDVIEGMHRSVPSFPPHMIHTLEKIGRKVWFYSIALDDRPGPTRLRSLPFDIQEKYSREPVQLLLSNGDTLQADVQNLTAAQAKQVFRDGLVCDLAKQRLWIEDQNRVGKVRDAKTAFNDYTIDKKRRGVVIAGMFFSLQKLARIQTEVLA